MAYVVNFSPLARLELLQAGDWHSQAEIQKGDAFLTAIVQNEPVLKNNPFPDAKVQGDVRRSVLKRCPYSLFDPVEGDEIVTVLSCFHQSRQPIAFSVTGVSTRP